jgi:PAS domain-containing protein
MTDNGMKLEPLPQIEFIHDDVDNGEDLFGKTAYYLPEANKVVLFTYGRHPKDILRSYAHELVHVHQNMENRLHNIDTTNVNDDDYLEQLEREAYETGNIMFRSWTDSLTGNRLEEATRKLITEKKKKDPFGLNAYALELARGLEEQISEYKVYLDMDGVLANFNKRFEDISGMSPKEFESKYGKKEFWKLIDEDNKISFWVGIEPMPGAADLVKAVKKYNYELLTSPSSKKQSYLGKILWVRNHSDILGGKPRINFKRASEKHEIKPELAKTDILIDDREDTIGRWNAAGGTGIHYKSISQVLNDLGKLGL